MSHKTQARGTSAAPTALDTQRYRDFRTGTSVEELATRENVRVATVQASIDKMISFRGQFSQEEAELAARQLFLQTMPDAAAALSGALAATRTETRKVLEREQDEFGNIQYVEREITEQEPDHKTRLSAISTWKSLPVAVMPKTPMVQVDARQQTVNQGLLPGGSGLALGSGSGGPLSAESIIMQIRRDRGLAAGDQAVLTPGSDASPTNMDRDFELEAELAEDGELDDEQPATAA